MAAITLSSKICSFIEHPVTNVGLVRESGVSVD